MTEQNSDTPPEENTGKLDAAIERVVKKTFGALLDSGKLSVAEGRTPAKQAEPQIDVAAQVKQAVKDAQAEDRRTAAEKQKDDTIAQLQAKLDSQEQRPREHRAISRIMGWVDKDDVS